MELVEQLGLFQSPKEADEILRIIHHKNGVTVMYRSSTNNIYNVEHSHEYYQKHNLTVGGYHTPR